MALQQTISPVDGSVYVERELASPKQIDEALARAKRAQLEWRQVPLAERAAICRRMVATLVGHTAEIATDLSWQMGRPVRFTPLEVEGGFAERASYMIDNAAEALADLEIEAEEGLRRFIRREPLGVVLTLAPWNYPYLTSVNSVVPAIMAGNAVILKHSEQTPLCSERYAEAFVAAGLPDGVFQYLHMTHDDVANVVADERVDYVSFTGSVPGGHAVQGAASGRFVGIGLELGGKDAAYVRPDANLERTLEGLVDGVFFNAGQSCCGIERIYLHEDIYDAFVQGFVDLTRQYKLGNPLDPETTLGPLVRSSAADFVRAQTAEAIQQGAKALIDSSLFPLNKAGTPYLAPQVLVNVDHGMRVMREETFGPLVGIMRVKSDEEAVGYVNDSRFGLTASVWTRDQDAALRLTERLEVGTCFMNRCDYLDPALAWTAVKDSGRGCSLSVLGYGSLTRPKSFNLRIE